MEVNVDLHNVSPQQNLTISLLTFREAWVGLELVLKLVLFLFVLFWGGHHFKNFVFTKYRLFETIA